MTQNGPIYAARANLRIGMNDRRIWNAIMRTGGTELKPSFCDL